MRRSVVVLGAGAVGSLFGARLAAQGHDVLLVGRAEHVRAIRRNGLVVEGREGGTFHVAAETALPPAARPDAVLVTVKSFDLETACRELARQLPAAPAAFPGNGLGIEATATEALRVGGWPTPERWVVRAVTTVPATLLGPGRVRASGAGEIVLPEPVGPAADAIRAFAELFGAGAWTLRSTADLDRELWRKAAVNAAINPVTALHRVANGRLQDGPLRAEAIALLDEAVEVARAVGVRLDAATALADLERVVAATAENRSSMLQDLDRGRPTEIEAISGEILRRGEGRGLSLPATRRTVDAVRAEAARRSRTAQP